MTPKYALHAVSADSAIGRNRKRQKKLIKASKANRTLPVKGGDPPVGGEYPLTCLGVTSEAFGDALGEYVRSNPDSSLKCEPLLYHLASSSIRMGFCHFDPFALKLADFAAIVPSGVTLSHAGPHQSFGHCELFCPLKNAALCAISRCNPVLGSIQMQYQ